LNSHTRCSSQAPPKGPIEPQNIRPSICPAGSGIFFFEELAERQEPAHYQRNVDSSCSLCSGYPTYSLHYVAVAWRGAHIAGSCRGRQVSLCSLLWATLFPRTTGRPYKLSTGLRGQVKPYATDAFRFDDRFGTEQRRPDNPVGPRSSCLSSLVALMLSTTHKPATGNAALVSPLRAKSRIAAPYGAGVC
jgi:hypothetical protein